MVELVTVYVYVAEARPVIVLVVPVPVVVIVPGVLVNVQVPVDGSPFKITLPVASAQVGCVIVPTVGADGVALTVAVTFNLEALSQVLTVWLA